MRAAVLVALVAVAGCRVEGLQFKNDHRLTILEPAARDKVTLPLLIRWSMTDFEAVGLDGSSQADRGAFVVFVDRAPMAMGSSLESLANSDARCKRDPNCPNEQYFTERGIYVTTETSLTLELLPASANGRGDEQHYINIVLVDGTGHRIGESAWYLPFVTDRRLL